MWRITRQIGSLMTKDGLNAGYGSNISKSMLHNPKRTALWSVEREQVKLPPVEDIVNEQKINEMLERTKERAKDRKAVADILQKARDRALLKDSVLLPQSEYVQGLNLEETATLLNMSSDDEDAMQNLFATALHIKRAIYGNRIVLFAPLYVSNYCVASCMYCAYRGANKHMPRAALTEQELKDEVEALEKMGHKRIMMLTGESPKFTFDNFLKALDVAYNVKTEPHGEIRRINVEIPTLSTSDFRRLKATNQVGTYVLFQETYHRETYKQMHPSGHKSLYDHRLLTMDRAQIAGLDDVGIGALFGLYDYRFEVMAMLMHAMHLDKTYGTGPHTISIPRLRPADNAPASTNAPYPVSDKDFMKLVAIIRCAVPYTGMILTTRETPEMRRALLNLGISQMSAGSKTDVGSYKNENGDRDTEEKEHPGQFSLGDHRSADEVIKELMEMNFIPSWCTACYRLGRTGEKFMKIAKKGDIQNCCHPNALMTLAEYLHDYADEDAKKIGWDLIEKEKETIPSKPRRKSLQNNLERIAAGARDLYY